MLQDIRNLIMEFYTDQTLEDRLNYEIQGIERFEQIGRGASQGRSIVHLHLTRTVRVYPDNYDFDVEWEDIDPAIGFCVMTNELGQIRSCGHFHQSWLP